MAKIVGVILAGGHSRRMGKDKSLLDFNGKTLLQRMIDEHNIIVDDVYVIGKKPPLFKNAHGILDKVKNIGPIAGLYTAMVEIAADWYLISPCDMPFLNHQDLQVILNAIHNQETDAVIAKSQKGKEPLVAAYHKNVFHTLEKNIKSGNYTIRSLFNKINKIFIEFDEQKFEKDSFYNINYPDDYIEALKR